MHENFFSEQDLIWKKIFLKFLGFLFFINNYLTYKQLLVQIGTIQISFNGFLASVRKFICG